MNIFWTAEIRIIQEIPSMEGLYYEGLIQNDVRGRVGLIKTHLITHDWKDEKGIRYLTDIDGSIYRVVTDKCQ